MPGRLPSHARRLLEGGNSMRELRAGAVILVLAVVVAACGETGPTPAASGSAAPVASVTTESPAPVSSESPAAVASPVPPVDVTLAAADKLADPQLETTVTVDATTKVGKTTIHTTGTIDVAGRASHLVRTDATGKSKAKVETLTANGTRYVKVKGVWTNAGPADETDLVAVLRGMTGVTDLGVETKDGAQLHHLQAPALGVIPRDLALVTKDVTDVTGTVDAWVEEDGTPVSMTITSAWTQPVGKKTVDASRTATLTFGEPLADGAIIAPSETWKFWNSKRYQYRMAYPDTWEAKAGKGRFADSFYGGEEYAYASRARSGGVSLSYINSRILTQLKTITGYKKLKVMSNKKAKLDGRPARRIEFRGTSNGEKVYGQAIYAVKGAFWYFIGFDSYTKWNDELRDEFSSMIGTFDYK
jgi:hypothetical protein